MSENIVEELKTIESPVNLTLICKCSKCGAEKELNRENFNVNSKEKNGFSKWCKTCKKTANQKRYSEKKQIIIHQNQKWQQNNLHKVIAYQKKWKREFDRKIKIQKSLDNEAARNKCGPPVDPIDRISTDTILQ